MKNYLKVKPVKRRQIADNYYNYKPYDESFNI